ncbi:TPA: hypothetical protein ACUM0E_001312, partial [Haemophilus influenzae]
MGFSPPKYLTIVCWWAKAHPTTTEALQNITIVCWWAEAHPTTTEAHQNISRLFIGGLKPTLQLLISTINGSHYRKQARLNTENNENSFYFLILIKNTL